MQCKPIVPLILMLLSCPVAAAPLDDLYFPPTSSSGHDFNHAPLGQSFKALASDVEAGIFMADGNSFTQWLQETYPYLPPYPYAVAGHITVKVQLLEGEGVGGAVLDTEIRDLTPPFMSFLAVDYAAKGVFLEVGNDYTLLLTDISGQSYPNGVTGWVVPAIAPGSYGDGRPILQGAVVTNEAVGDNSFEVLDISAVAPLVVSSTLPDGEVGQPYSASLTANGGKQPYEWDVAGLPNGLALDVDTIAGTPVDAGVSTVLVTVTDSLGATATAEYELTINDDSGASCIKPAGAKSSKGKGTVTGIGDGYIVVGRGKYVDYAACTEVHFGGDATVPAIGDRVEWQGFTQSNGDAMAQVLTFN